MGDQHAHVSRFVGRPEFSGCGGGCGRRRRRLSRPPPAETANGSCTIADTGIALSVAHDNATLRLNITTGGGSVSERVSIGLGESEISNRTINLGADGVAHLRETIVDAHGHAHSAELYMSKAGLITGTIDGLPLRPFQKGDDYSSLRLADGSPVPYVEMDPATTAETQALYDLAKTKSTECVASPDGTRPQALSVPAGVEHPSDQVPCTACKSVCISGSLACGIAFGVTCAAFPWPANLVCAIVGALVCLVQYFLCADNCSAQGQGCCPVACGGGCCNSGSTCVLSASQLCCPSGTSNCSATNCCDGSETCISKTAECCPNNRDICGSTCCPSGTTCGDASAGAGLCCATGTVACNGVCCEQGAACIQDSPTAPKHCGTCSVPLCGNLCCDQPGVGCAKPDTCCLQKTICTNGSCCNGNETCTGPTSFKQTCCADAHVCGQNAELCCGLNNVGVQTQCATSSLNNNTATCCDLSAHNLCGVNCCDDPLFPNCDAAGNCAQ
ncbi:hypothetical protein BH09MYX1_BH09MYX1_24270 [soil metagenome]